MKNTLIKIIQLFLIIFPIILLPLSFMFCITNEHLMLVNNSNRDEIISFIGNNSNIDYSEKNIVDKQLESLYNTNNSFVKQ